MLDPSPSLGGLCGGNFFYNNDDITLYCLASLKPLDPEHPKHQPLQPISKIQIVPLGARLNHNIEIFYISIRHEHAKQTRRHRIVKTVLNTLHL